MDYTQLQKYVKDYFGDKGRSQGETKRDLLALSEECQCLAESLEDDDELQEFDDNDD